MQNKNAGPDLILLFTTFQAKGFPPTSAKCTENHWLVKDVSDSLPEKRNKKATFSHPPTIHLYSITKYEIEKVINFFFIFIQKKGVSVQYRFYILRPFTFFLIHSPKTEVTAFVHRRGK